MSTFKHKLLDGTIILLCEEDEEVDEVQISKKTTVQTEIQAQVIMTETVVPLQKIEIRLRKIETKFQGIEIKKQNQTQ